MNQAAIRTEKKRKVVLQEGEEEEEDLKPAKTKRKAIAKVHIRPLVLVPEVNKLLLHSL